MGYMIFRIIQTHEKPDACVCDGNSKNIADDLNKLDNGNWNVFCYTTSALFYLSIYPRNDKYLFTKGKNCYYGIYEV